ncbi:MAG: DNA-directed RNA polymerase subunit E [Candidatus Pacearchaeota archaeon]|nr:DNA-directed RNA polymerase subunit E [Candidatus Pacearchaeota archaeon]
MAKEKACKICKAIYDEDVCPKCGAKETTEGFKGKIAVLNYEKSEISKKLNINSNGEFAIKIR